MGCLHFSDDEKEELIQKLTNALPALRGAAKVFQSELAEAVGVSRQTYVAIELRKNVVEPIYVFNFLTIARIHIISLDSLTNFHIVLMNVG